MISKLNVAILGSTGFVGIELIKILLRHPYVTINYLGCENYANQEISSIDKFFFNKNLPKLKYNNEFNFSKSDVVFMCLPHNKSSEYIRNFYDKIKIIDLSADFRLDDIDSYKKDYGDNHDAIHLLDKFVYGLAEIYPNQISNTSNIAVPGCYPTSILLPLIPLFKSNLIITDDIIIDSKSGYSGAGKKFDISNIKNKNSLNFYNYNTNQHRHMTEIDSQLKKYTSNKIEFTFNPHILPIFRGMMSSIYCSLQSNILIEDLKDYLLNFYKNTYFVKILENQKERADFNLVINTNNCYIKLYNKPNDSRLIIVSIIDNLLKGASGQAIQCFNLMNEFDENLSLV